MNDITEEETLWAKTFLETLPQGLLPQAAQGQESASANLWQMQKDFDGQVQELNQKIGSLSEAIADEDLQSKLQVQIHELAVLLGRAYRKVTDEQNWTRLETFERINSIFLTTHRKVAGLHGQEGFEMVRKARQETRAIAEKEMASLQENLEQIEEKYVIVAKQKAQSERCHAAEIAKLECENKKLSRNADSLFEIAGKEYEAQRQLGEMEEKLKGDAKRFEEQLRRKEYEIISLKNDMFRITEHQRASNIAWDDFEESKAAKVEITQYKQRGLEMQAALNTITFERDILAQNLNMTAKDVLNLAQATLWGLEREEAENERLMNIGSEWTGLPLAQKAKPNEPVSGFPTAAVKKDDKERGLPEQTSIALETENTELKQKLEAVEAETSAAEKTKADMEGEKAKVTIEKAELDCEAKKLRIQLSAFDDLRSVVELTGIVERLAVQVEDLENERDELDIKIVSLTRERDMALRGESPTTPSTPLFPLEHPSGVLSLQDELSSVDCRRESVASMLGRPMLERPSSVYPDEVREQDDTQLQRDNERLQAEVQHFLKQIEDLMTEKEALRAKPPQIGSDDYICNIPEDTEFADTKENIKDKMREVQRLEEQVDDLSKQLQRINNPMEARVRIEQLRREMKGLRQRCGMYGMAPGPFGFEQYYPDDSTEMQDLRREFLMVRDEHDLMHVYAGYTHGGVIRAKKAFDELSQVKEALLLDVFRARDKIRVQDSAMSELNTVMEEKPTWSQLRTMRQKLSQSEEEYRDMAAELSHQNNEIRILETQLKNASNPVSVNNRNSATSQKPLTPELKKTCACSLKMKELDENFQNMKAVTTKAGVITDNRALQTLLCDRQQEIEKLKSQLSDCNECRGEAQRIKDGLERQLQLRTAEAKARQAQAVAIQARIDKERQNAYKTEGKLIDNLKEQADRMIKRLSSGDDSAVAEEIQALSEDFDKLRGAIGAVTDATKLVQEMLLSTNDPDQLTSDPVGSPMSEETKAKIEALAKVNGESNELMDKINTTIRSVKDIKPGDDRLADILKQNQDLQAELAVQMRRQEAILDTLHIAQEEALRVQEELGATRDAVENIVDAARVRGDEEHQVSSQLRDTILEMSNMLDQQNFGLDAAKTAEETEKELRKAIEADMEKLFDVQRQLEECQKHQKSKNAELEKVEKALDATNNEVTGRLEDLAAMNNEKVLLKDLIRDLETQIRAAQAVAGPALIKLEIVPCMLAYGMRRKEAGFVLEEKVKQLEKLRTQLVAAEKKVIVLEQRVKEIEGEKDSLREEIERLTTTAEERDELLHPEALKANDGRLRVKGFGLATLENEIDTLKLCLMNKAADMEGPRDDAGYSRQKAGDLSKNLMEYPAEGERKGNLIARLTKDIDQLLSHQRRLTTRNQELEPGIHKFEIIRQNMMQQAHLQAYESTARQKELLREAMDAKVARDDARKHVDEVQKALEKCEKHGKELNREKRETARRFEADIRRAQDKLAAAEDKIRQAPEKKELQRLRNAFAKAEANLAAAEAKVPEAIVKEIGQLHGDLKQAKSDLQECETKLGRAQCTIPELETQISQLEKNLSAAQGSIPLRETEVLKLMKALVTTRNELAELQGARERLDQLQGQVAATEPSIPQGTQDEIQWLRDELAKAQKAVAEIETGVEEERGSLIEESQDLKNVAAGLKIRMEELKQERKAVEDHLNKRSSAEHVEAEKLRTALTVARRKEAEKAMLLVVIQERYLIAESTVDGLQEIPRKLEQALSGSGKSSPGLAEVLGELQEARDRLLIEKQPPQELKSSRCYLLPNRPPTYQLARCGSGWWVSLFAKWLLTQLLMAWIHVFTWLAGLLRAAIFSVRIVWSDTSRHLGRAVPQMRPEKVDAPAFELQWPPWMDIIWTLLQVLLAGFLLSWNAVRVERLMWLRANDLTRMYLIDIQQHPPWPWFLPGVDPRLMLRFF
jgi:chromosome segregation ATPase